MKKIWAWIAAGMIALSAASCSLGADTVGGSSFENGDSPIILKNVERAKNVILLIGDGMGPNQIKAGELFKGEALCMQGFPYRVRVETCSDNSTITDSAAAATALATGVRTNNGTVGLDPQGNTLTTIVDIAASLGKRTGVLTTEELYGATPMGFSGHNLARSNSLPLLESAAKDGNVNLFASYTYGTAYHEPFLNNGYTQVSSAADISEAEKEKIFGCYRIEADAPSMSADGYVAFDRLVSEALEYLSKDEDGFFLMAEGAHIDHGGHNNDIHYMLAELLAFDNAVEAALKWANGRDDTVVIVTADHETGGFMLGEDITELNMFDLDKYGDPLHYSWQTTGHSDTEVYCYINGADIDFSKYSFFASNRIKNTDVFKIMKTLLTGE